MENFGDLYGAGYCATNGGSATCNAINALVLGVYPTTIKYGAIYHMAYFAVGANFAPVTMASWIEDGTIEARTVILNGS